MHELTHYKMKKETLFVKCSQPACCGNIQYKGSRPSFKNGKRVLINIWECPKCSYVENEDTQIIDEPIELCNNGGDRFAAGYYNYYDLAPEYNHEFNVTGFRNLLFLIAAIVLISLIVALC